MHTGPDEFEAGRTGVTRLTSQNTVPKTTPVSNRQTPYPLSSDLESLKESLLVNKEWFRSKRSHSTACYKNNQSASRAEVDLYWFSVKLRREEAAEGENSALWAGIFKA